MQIEVQHRIWLENNKGFFLGSGRVQLLEAIVKTGSISKAAAELSMSYKKAWRLIDQLNTTADEPLVVKVSGGVNGGGTQVTQLGKDLLKQYRSLEEASNKHFNAINQNLQL